MSRVWKFPLRWGEVSVDMPRYAKVVHVGMDPASDYPAIWAIVVPELERETRQFALVPTGAEFSREWLHLGSVVEDNKLVWHIFESTPEQTIAAMLGAFA